MLLLYVLYLEGVEILQQFVVLSENASQHFQKFILLHKEKKPQNQHSITMLILNKIRHIYFRIWLNGA